eukprot:7883884-Karenia_brevis.AAC.1
MEALRSENKNLCVGNLELTSKVWDLEIRLRTATELSATSAQIKAENDQLKKENAKIMEANTALCSNARDLQLQCEALSACQDELEWQNHHLSSCSSIP